MLRRALVMVSAIAVVSMMASAPADGQLLKKLRGKGDKSSSEKKEKKKKAKDKDHRCEDVALEWVLEEDYSDLDPVNLTGVSAVPIEVGEFSDNRRIDDPREFGRNVEDEDDDDPEDRKTLYATTDDDFAAFVRKYTEEVLAELGYNVVGPGEGKIKITGDLRSFHVREDNTYKGSTRILFKVHNAASGAVLYEAMHGESESTFGRSYNCENYFVVLSESLMETVHSMAVEDDFYEALATAR